MKIYGERAKIGANCSTGQNWISTGQNWCSTGQNRAIFGFALLQQGKVSSTGQKQGITGRPVLSGQFGKYEFVRLGGNVAQCCSEPHEVVKVKGNGYT